MAAELEGGQQTAAGVVLHGGLAHEEQVGELLGGHELVKRRHGLVVAIGHGVSKVEAGVEIGSVLRDLGKEVGRLLEMSETLLRRVADVPAVVSFAIHTEEELDVGAVAREPSVLRDVGVVKVLRLVGEVVLVAAVVGDELVELAPLPATRPAEALPLCPEPLEAGGGVLELFAKGGALVVLALGRWWVGSQSLAELLLGGGERAVADFGQAFAGELLGAAATEEPA